MRLIFSASLLLILFACGDSNSDRTSKESTINKNNAQEIITNAMHGYQGLNAVKETIPDASKSPFELLKSNTLALFYCGENPMQDTGNGAMDVSFGGTLPTDYFFNIDFLQCQVIETLLIDGGYRLEFSGDGFIGPNTMEGQNTLTQTFDSLNLAETTTPLDLLANGNIVTEQAYTEPEFSWSDTVNLELFKDSHSVIFDNWTKQLVYNLDTHSLSLTLNGDLSISNQNGNFTFDMIEPLMFQANGTPGNVSAEFIISGKFKVTAEDGSSVTVTILDAEQALLEIDNDGDGTIDETLTINIADLSLFSAVVDN